MTEARLELQGQGRGQRFGTAGMGMKFGGRWGLEKRFI